MVWYICTADATRFQNGLVRFWRTVNCGLSKSGPTGPDPQKIVKSTRPRPWPERLAQAMHDPRPIQAKKHLNVHQFGVYWTMLPEHAAFRVMRSTHIKLCSGDGDDRGRHLVVERMGQFGVFCTSPLTQPLTSQWDVFLYATNGNTRPTCDVEVRDVEWVKSDQMVWMGKGFL